MESKQEAKGSSDSKGDDEGQSELQLQTQPPKNIVMKFTEYAFKVLNQDMDDFFEDNMTEFDQDSEELTSGQGETLQQYDVYQQYIAQLEKHFDRCVLDLTWVYNVVTYVNEFRHHEICYQIYSFLF